MAMSMIPLIPTMATGSTVERTRLYTRILRLYYPAFSKDFQIIGIARIKGKASRTSFNPASKLEYLAFLITRISAKDTLFPEKLAKAKEMLRDLEGL
jgi:hypothetical protein